MDELLEQLKNAEVDLQDPSTRRDARRVAAYLHESFIEFGRSGRTYDRTAMLDMLAAEEPAGRIVSEDFAVTPLGNAVALLTYCSAVIDASGNVSRYTLRASVWVRAEDGWKLRFHQGTPTDPFPIDEG